MNCSICGCADIMDFGHTALCLKCGKQIPLKAGHLSAHLSSAYLFLYEGEFVKADQYCDQALFENPNEAYAYLCKLLAKLHLRKAEDLTSYTRNFKDESYFLRAYSSADNVGDEELKARLLQYHSGMEQNAAKVRYERAKQIMATACSAQDWDDAAHWLEESAKYSSVYTDAATLLAECRSKEVLYTKAEEYYEQASKQMKAGSVDALRQAITLFEAAAHMVHGYKDCETKILLCEDMLVQPDPVPQPVSPPSDFGSHVNPAMRMMGTTPQHIEQIIPPKNEFDLEQMRQRQLQPHHYEKGLALMGEDATLEQLNEAFAYFSALAAEYGATEQIQQYIKLCCLRRNALTKQLREQELKQKCEKGRELMPHGATLAQLAEAIRYYTELMGEYGNTRELESCLRICTGRRNVTLIREQSIALPTRYQWAIKRMRPDAGYIEWCDAMDILVSIKADNPNYLDVDLRMKECSDQIRQRAEQHIAKGDRNTQSGIPTLISGGAYPDQARPISVNPAMRMASASPVQQPVPVNIPKSEQPIPPQTPQPTAKQPRGIFGIIKKKK